MQLFNRIWINNAEELIHFHQNFIDGSQTVASAGHLYLALQVCMQKPMVTMQLVGTAKLCATRRHLMTMAPNRTYFKGQVANISKTTYTNKIQGCRRFKKSTRQLAINRDSNMTEKSYSMSICGKPEVINYLISGQFWRLSKWGFIFILFIL